MTIKYKVSKKIGKETIFKNDMLIRSGKWDDPKFHKRIRKLIYKYNPGWMIIGYAKIDRRKKEIVEC